MHIYNGGQENRRKKMRALGFILLGAFMASIVMNQNVSTQNHSDIAKTKERIAEASRARG